MDCEELHTRREKHVAIEIERKRQTDRELGFAPLFYTER